MQGVFLNHQAALCRLEINPYWLCMKLVLKVSAKDVSSKQLKTSEGSIRLAPVEVGQK